MTTLPQKGSYRLNALNHFIQPNLNTPREYELSNHEKKSHINCGRFWCNLTVIMTSTLHRIGHVAFRLLFHRDINIIKNYLTNKKIMALVKQETKVPEALIHTLHRIGLISEKEAALELDRSAAERNNVESQLKMCWRYLLGVGVARSQEQALHYCELAASQKNANAQFIAGDIYKSIMKQGSAAHPSVIDDSTDNYINFAKALYYSELAAKQGHMLAQLNTGFLYLSQKKQDALYYFYLAAEQGCVQAQFYTGLLYHLDKDSNEQHCSSALYYYQLAAKQDLTTSQAVAKQIYADLKKIDLVHFNQRLSEYESAESEHRLMSLLSAGNMHCIGEGLPCPAPKEALKYYQTAAALGHIEAAFRAANILYSVGESETPDHEKALHYYQAAANGGHVQAQLCTANMYSKGEGLISANLKQALKYYEAAAKQGDRDAQLFAGAMHYRGEGTAQDLAKAIQYFQAAGKELSEALQEIATMHTYAVPKQNNKTRNENAVDMFNRASNSFKPNLRP